ncbi:MAG: rod shape-determining protein MreC [bacterium]|nr:rod shape-determining protein MreC [bacterium]
MMNLYQPNNPNRLGRRRLLIASILVVFIFVLDGLSAGKIRAVVHTTVGFIWQRGVGVVEAVGSTGFFSTRRALERRIKDLSDEVMRLNELSAHDRVLKDENERLRALVNLAVTVPGITAPIISSFKSSPYGTFMVGAGSVDGISAGNLIVSPGGFVIGRISNVGQHSSLAREVFAPNTTVEAVINGSATTVEGQGAGNAHARLPHGVTVEVGDPVTSPVFGGRAIGIVGFARSDAASAYSDVYIGLPVSVESLRFVYIEK